MESVAAGIALVAVRTPTLPPATHTNAWVVGDGAMSVFDPASPWEDEQARLAAAIDARVQAGERLERIVLTHHHHDHVGGAIALKERYPEVPIVAHRVTAELLHDIVPVDVFWDDDQVLDCGGRGLRGIHTPGHAPGHLVFHDVDSGAVIAGDMVAGVGTILISPIEGHLGQYLDSLQRMRELDPSVLLPAHGPAMQAADQLLAFYIAHRHQRTDQVRQALDALGTATPLGLVPHVYAGVDLPVEAHPIAAAQITSHLQWMQEQGMAELEAGRWNLV